MPQEGFVISVSVCRMENERGHDVDTLANSTLWAARWASSGRGQLQQACGFTAV
jgi:hypothetical protein